MEADGGRQIAILHATRFGNEGHRGHASCRQVRDAASLQRIGVLQEEFKCRFVDSLGSLSIDRRQPALREAHAKRKDCFAPLSRVMSAGTGMPGF